jgi:hypothetical protein
MSTQAIVFAIKLLHTGVFFFVSACILYVPLCGIIGRVSRRMLLAATWIPICVGVPW